MLRASRMVAVAVAVAVAAVVGSSVVPTAATPPEAGAAYHGQVIGAPSTQDSVAFTVSARGTSVRKLSVGPYVLTGSCGSGGDPPQQSSKPAPIRKGRFTAEVVYRAGGEVVARAIVTGRFLHDGKEKGTVTTDTTGANPCHQSMPYTAHAE